MGVTMNGFARVDLAADARLADVSVAGHSTRLLAGPVAIVLVEVGRRFDAEVEPVTEFNGWRDGGVNSGAGGIGNSNHLSGTAVDINGRKHPRFVHGTFTPDQVVAIRRIIADLQGVVRWGGDWNGDGRLTESNADEMHFEIVAGEESVATVAKQIGEAVTALVEEEDMTPDQVAVLQGISNMLADPSLGVFTNGPAVRSSAAEAAAAAKQAQIDAANAAAIASDVRNLILDPNNGILHAIGELASQVATLTAASTPPDDQ